APAQTGPTVPILVKFKSTASATDIGSAISSNGGQDVRAHSQINTHVINVPANAVDQIVAAYARHTAVAAAAPAIKLGKATTPNDPGYAQQWALPKIGWDQAYGVVNVPGAAKIAVLDTGVDATHPDLA